jgi:hypothetical protein
MVMGGCNGALMLQRFDNPDSVIEVFTQAW